MDAEDGDEEQRHQADALQAPSAVLSRPGMASSSVSCASVLLAWGPWKLDQAADPYAATSSCTFSVLT